MLGATEQHGVGFYFWLGLLISSMSLSLRALGGSKREQFGVGVYAAAIRALTVIPLGTLLVAAYFPRLTGALPWLRPFVVVAIAVMPASSFVALGRAFRQMQNAPAIQEEKASRPFNIWLPVAIVDAIIVVIALVVALLSRPWH